LSECWLLSAAMVIGSLHVHLCLCSIDHDHFPVE